MPTRTRLWQIIRRVLLILAVLAAVFFFGVVPWFFTHILTRGSFTYPDRNLGKTPQAFGMEFRWVAFQSPDGTPLRGWFIPAPGAARGTVLYCHGLNRSRVEMLQRAKFGHEFGYNGLLFDFRHAGQSGGDLTTLGYQERLDVLAALRFALEQEKAARPVVVWGVSMGAAAALMAAADSEDIAAVIADSSFLSFSHTIKHHMRLYLPFLPAFPIADQIILWSAWRGGFRPADFDLERAVERIGTSPVLFIAVEGDRRMPPEIARRLRARAASPDSRLVILPGKRHGEGFNQQPELYQKAVAEFLEKIQ